MTTNPVSDAVHNLIAPIVRDLGLDLYDLTFNGGVLLVTVDTPAGSDGGVTLDQLALVTRLVSRDLDHHDPIPSHYTLEVSSPGLERTLRTPAHYQRELGKSVNIRLRAGVSGDRRLRGVLLAADDQTVTIRLDDAADSERVVHLDTIDRARTVFEWGPAPKPGSAGRGAAKPGGKRSASTTGSRAAASGKPAPGPSDELDPPIEQEATA